MTTPTRHGGAADAARVLQPLRIRAYLAGGIAQAAPWGIALDGLLAAEVWAAQKDDCRRAGQPYRRAMDSPDPPDLDLPLARCQPPGGGPWHWAATCAHPDRHPHQPAHRTDVHTWTGRVDARALEQVAAGLPQVVSHRQGRYRARRMPLLVTVCPSVIWHAVGDLDQITALLTPVGSIGKKRRSGEGHVLGWDITPAPDLDDLTAGHLHPDGTLGRTTPQACLQHLRSHTGHRSGDLVDGGYGRAGIRPPYMHPARQHDLHLPALLGA